MDDTDLFYAKTTLESGFYMEKSENNGFLTIAACDRQMQTTVMKLQVNNINKV